MATEVARLKAILDADTRGFDRKMSSSESSFSKVGKNMGRIAVLAGAAVATGLAVGAAKAVGAASNLGEQINKTAVVFENSAASVHRWSRGLARNFGISQRAALEAAGTFGNMLKPMGLAPALAAKMSMKMAELAGDLASFNNASPEETLDALRAGLAGETEPLRRFGVFLDMARVKQEAVRLGLIKTTKDDLPAAAKAQATYSLILKDTTDAQGDFARTSKSLPNLLRTIKATVENLAARIGEKLLPIVAAAVGQFESLLNFIDKVTKAGDLTLSIKVIWLGVKGLAGDLFEAVQKMLLGSAGTLKPLKLPTGKIVEFERVGQSSGLVASLQEMFEKIDWARIGKRVGESISEAIHVSNEWVGRALDTAAEWVDSHSSELAELGAKMALQIIDKLLDPEFWAKNWKLVLGIAVAVFPIGRIGSLGGKIGLALIKPLERFIPERLATIGARAVDEVGHQFRRLPAIVQEAFRRAYTFAKTQIQNIINFLRTKFKAVLDKIPGWVKAAFRLGALVTFISFVQNLIDKIKDLIDWIKKIPNVNPFRGGGSGGLPEAPGSRPPGSNPNLDSVRSFRPRLAPGGGGMTIDLRGATILDDVKLLRVLDQARERQRRRGGR